MEQKCELERRVIANALSIAVSTPDMFAYQITRKHGYMAIVAGEVVHLMKCEQVDVTRRDTTRCYQELPVLKSGKEFFLTPRTHILKQYGTETSCNSLIAPMFLLEDDWYTVLPRSASKGREPLEISPHNKGKWNYTDPIALAKSGIYTYSEIEALKQHLMFPVERPSVLNTIAMGMAGASSSVKGLSLGKFLDDEMLEKLADNTWNRIWGKFLTFGSASAGVIGIFIIMRCVKFIADTIIHGYALYSLYGWSIHVLGCVWNSVTQLLLHIGRDKPNTNDTRYEQDEDKRTNTPSTSKQQVDEERKTVHGPSVPPRNPLNHLPPQQYENRVNITENQLYPYLNSEVIIPSLPPKKKRKTDNRN